MKLNGETIHHLSISVTNKSQGRNVASTYIEGLSSITVTRPTPPTTLPVDKE